MEITNERFRQLAKDLYQKNGRIEIDDNAIVSRGAVEGVYVQAWVWVGAEDEDEEADECADNTRHPTDSCTAPQSPGMAMAEIVRDLTDPENARTIENPDTN